MLSHISSITAYLLYTHAAGANAKTPLTESIGVVFWGLDHSCLEGLSVARGVD